MVGFVLGGGCLGCDNSTMKQGNLGRIFSFEQVVDSES
jgi:hypothetical protein